MQYRKQIYSNYHSTHVNANAVDHRSLLKQQASYYERELIPHLSSSKSASILEIGCGFGSFIKAARDAGFTAIEGVDLSKEQIEIAHSMGINQAIEGNLFDHLEAPNARDAIVGIDIIEHFSKDEFMELLASCQAHLKQGAYLLCRTPNMDAPLASVYAHADFSHELFLNKSSALQAFRAAGFSKVEVYPSLIYNASPWKEFLRKPIWALSLFFKKLMLFGSGRTWDSVVFSPNLIIKAYKD